jgi:thiol-disulfide isomerase/thioredoxin
MAKRKSPVRSGRPVEHVPLPAPPLTGFAAITAQPFITLYFFMQGGCGACHEATPHLQRWQRKNRRINVITLNIGIKDWKIEGWSPKGTPGYLLVRDNEVLRKREGVLTEDELDRWVKGALTGNFGEDFDE